MEKSKKLMLVFVLLALSGCGSSSTSTALSTTTQSPTTVDTTVTPTTIIITTTTAAPTCAQGSVCQLGDVGPGGGVVFYVQPGGGTFACGPTLSLKCRYLEAAPSSGPSAWIDEKFIWSGTTKISIGSSARAVAVGSGFKNTEAMIAQDATPNRAGTAARAYLGPNNLSDWYLPSKDELNELCKYALNTGQAPGAEMICSVTTADPTLFGFTANDYWSSTEDGYSSAWVQKIENGWQSSLIKSAGNILAASVRPIRSFDAVESTTESIPTQVITTTAAPTCAQGSVCQLGDVGPGGGVVFYVQPGGGTFACGPTLSLKCRYLEAAPSSGPSAWIDEKFIWSGTTKISIGSSAGAVAVGSGFKNTEAMIAQDATPNRAGTAARAYLGPNNLSDWYLPSKDELIALCSFSPKQEIASTLFFKCVSKNSDKTEGYWSSTEYGDETAWSREASLGSQATVIKNLDLRVRPIRSFD